MSRVDDHDWRPRNCVWELTLACNLRCAHCGSSAGRPLERELTTDECLRVVADLAALGCEHVTLSGGEPTLRADWQAIARAIAARGMKVNLVTHGVLGGRSASARFARAALDAGLANAGVSVDGTEETHDALRGPGAFRQAIATIGECARAGLPATAMTTVHRLNLGELARVRQRVLEAGAVAWRLQLGKPMGNLRHRPEIVLRPTDIRELVPTLARLKQAGGIELLVGDSIGYYGPLDETLRGRGWRGRAERWQGCQAGLQAIGIEADGTVKGCLSLQGRRALAVVGRGDPFAEGNLRESSLEEIWRRPGAFAYNRDFQPSSLTGHCARCPQAALCRGGARCVSSSVLGHLGEDPYCYLRVTALDRRAEGDERPSRLRQAAAAAAVVLGIGMGAGCETSTTTRKDAARAADLARPADLAAPEEDLAEPEDMAAPADARKPTDLRKPVDGTRRDATVSDGGKDMPPAPDLSAQDQATPPDLRCANVCCACDYGVPPPPECCN